MFVVYHILYEGETIYYGQTNDINRREKQHNYALHKKFEKQLYKYLRERRVDKIELIQLREFKTRVEAKRFEMMLILMRHFAGYKLQQKIPSISDR